MIFTDLRFIALFAAAWVCFVAAPRSWRPAILAIWGVIFYGLYANVFLFVVLALALAVYVAERRAPAIAVGAIVVALLGFFKMQAAGIDLGLTLPTGAATLFVPLGLSYLSFELLHVLVERRRGRIPRLSFPELLAFVFFVPARIAGPIKRYPDFIAAVRDATVTTEHVYAGLVRVLIGLAKKFLIADVLRLTVESELVYVGSAAQAWKILLSYTFQVYLDFSAYSDMAIGFALMLGIVLPENFRWPYLASNIRDFWDRWHITLSHWVRDYIFVPTGRTLFQTRLRSFPAVIAVLSYLVTFLIVGIWHGLTIGFVVWGIYHGVLLSGYHVIRAKTPARVAAHPLYHSRFADALGVAMTFAFVAVGWVPFMTSWERASMMLGLMFGVAR